MAEQFTNNAETTLNGGINNSVTSLVVTSATGFPASGNFRILVVHEGSNTDEIMTVTAVSGTTFTVTRASEATAGVQSASAHASGATVKHVLTAASLVTVNPYYFDNLPLDSTFGDEFDGTSLNGRWTMHGGLAAYMPRYAQAGTWMQFAGSTTTSYTIFQSSPSKDIFEIITAHSEWTNADAMTGPFIVSSTGTGVLACVRYGQNAFYLNNASSYAYTSDGVSSSLNATTDEGRKIWISLRQFKTGLNGNINIARISLDGVIWGRPLSFVPSSFTTAKIGWGPGYNSGAGANDQVAVDRFNVINALNLGNNLCITPSSGTVTPTASSNFSGLTPSRAIDGTSNDWAANTGNTDNPLYFQIAWSVGQTLNRVAIKERSGDNFGVGHIEFNDGSTTTYVAIDDKMGGSGTTWHLVEFPTLTGITTMKIVSDLGGTANGGFIEVEAYLAS